MDKKLALALQNTDFQQKPSKSQPIKFKSYSVSTENNKSTIQYVEEIIKRLLKGRIISLVIRCR